MPRFKPLLGALLAILMSAAAAPTALAQAKFPSKPIRLLVPFAPGGGVDVVARIVGQKISEQTGQPVLVESKPGAGGALAVNELMRAEPDGYTLLVTTSSHATLPVLAKLPWHPSNDFTPVAGIYSTMFVMATNKASTAQFRNLDGVPGLRPGQSGQDQLGLVGHRRPAAPRRHAVHQGCRRRHGARALSRQRADASGAAAERRPAHVRHADLVHAAHPGRQAHRARRHRRTPDAEAARRPDRERGREARLHHRHLDFRARPEGNPRTGPDRAEQGIHHGARRQERSASG